MNKTEEELRIEAEALLSEHKGPAFAVQSSANIDRLVTLFKAAKHTGRVFLEDVYSAGITSSVRGSIPNPIDFPPECLRVFLAPSAKNLQDYHYRLLQNYPEHKIGRSEVAMKRFLMLARPSMMSYIIKLSEMMDFSDGVLFYSMWNGYRTDEKMASFISGMEKLGVETVDLHTSGHADSQTILELVQNVKPTTIIPVHTENAQWFKETFRDVDVRL